MTFLFWTFIFFFGTYLFFRAFGKQILQLTMQSLAKRALRDMEKSSRAYQMNYDEGNMRESVYVDKDIKVTAPKNMSKPPVTADEIAEDIEFEEIR